MAEAKTEPEYEFQTVVFKIKAGDRGAIKDLLDEYMSRSPGARRELVAIGYGNYFDTLAEIEKLCSKIERKVFDGDDF